MTAVRLEAWRLMRPVYRPATPSHDRDQWVYWKNRWDRFVVRFADGIVVGVQN